MIPFNCAFRFQTFIHRKIFIRQIFCIAFYHRQIISCLSRKTNCLKASSTFSTNSFWHFMNLQCKFSNFKLSFDDWCPSCVCFIFFSFWSSYGWNFWSWFLTLMIMIWTSAVSWFIWTGSIHFNVSMRNHNYKT